MSDEEETKDQRREKLLQNLAKGRATRLENIKKKKANVVTTEMKCKFCDKSYKSAQYLEKHQLTCKKRPQDEKSETEDEKEDEKMDLKVTEKDEKSESEDEKPIVKKKKKKKIIYESESDSSSEEEVIVRKKKKSKKKKKKKPEPFPEPPKLERQKRTLTIAQYEELKRQRIQQEQIKKMKEEQDNQQRIMDKRINDMINGNM